MLDEKLLVEKAKEYYKKQYLLLEKDFMKMVEESKVTVPTNEKEKCLEEYNRGYSQGFKNGIQCAFKMKENADGCVGCYFDSTEPWEMPCRSCSRGNKDYWRGKGM